MKWARVAKTTAIAVLVVASAYAGVAGGGQSGRECGGIEVHLKIARHRNDVTARWTIENGNG